MSGLAQTVVGDVAGKRLWRDYRARTKALPVGYREAAEAVERYLMYRGIVTDGDVLVSMHQELVGEFEGAARSSTPLRDLVGPDPVRFADDLLGKYAASEWIDTERKRLVTSIAQAELRTGVSQ